MYARTIALATLVASTFAGIAVAKDAGNATDAINPYSPRYGHPYRHGVHPTRETHEKMKAWAAAHRGVVRPGEGQRKDKRGGGSVEPAAPAHGRRQPPQRRGAARSPGVRPGGGAPADAMSASLGPLNQ